VVQATHVTPTTHTLSIKVHVKELKPKEKQFDGRMKGFVSMPSKFDGKLKLPELREKKYDALIEPKLGKCSFSLQPFLSLLLIFLIT